MKIAILTPSRQRPAGLDRLIKSVFELAANADDVLMFNYIDTDDPELNAYKEYDYQNWNNTNIYDKHRWQSFAWNVCARQAYKAGADILIMGNDDLVYRTKNWDKILKSHVERYPDQIFCMWFQDGIHGGKYCAFPIVSRLWYETVGYFVPNIQNFTSNDAWVYDLGVRLGRLHYIDNAINEHLHYSVKKSKFDETYQRHRIGGLGNLPVESAKIMYSPEKALHRARDAEKLRVLMNPLQVGYQTEEPDQPTRLRPIFQWIYNNHFRSNTKIINSSTIRKFKPKDNRALINMGGLKNQSAPTPDSLPPTNWFSSEAHSPGVRWYSKYAHWLMPKIMDFGCGTGSAVGMFRQDGMMADGIDFVRLPNGMLRGDISKQVNIEGFETSVCFDVVAHLTDDELIGLFENMKQTPKQVITIHTGPMPAIVNHRFVELHINQKSPDKWHELLAKHFNVCEFTKLAEQRYLALMEPHSTQ